jgi:hypothetical protein
MQETRHKDSIKQSLSEVGITGPHAEAIANLTQRDKDGVFVNPAYVELLKGKIKEADSQALSKKDQMNMQLQSIETGFKTIESPTALDNYGRIQKRNQVLTQFGQQPEPLPPVHEAGGGSSFNPLNWFGDNSVHNEPDTVASTFRAEAEAALKGNQNPQPAKIFGAPAATGPIRVKNDKDIRRALMDARQRGQSGSIVVQGPDNKPVSIPIP